MKTRLLKGKIKVLGVMMQVATLATMVMTAPIVANATKAEVEKKLNDGFTSILATMQVVFGGLSAICIGYVAYLFLLGGDEGKQKGKKQLIYIVIAFALCFMATTICGWLESTFKV